MSYLILYFISTNLIFSTFISHYSFLNDNNFTEDINSNAIYEMILPDHEHFNGANVQANENPIIQYHN